MRKRKNIQLRLTRAEKLHLIFISIFMLMAIMLGAYIGVATSGHHH